MTKQLTGLAAMASCDKPTPCLPWQKGLKALQYLLLFLSMLAMVKIGRPAEFFDNSSWDRGEIWHLVLIQFFQKSSVSGFLATGKGERGLS